MLEKSPVKDVSLSSVHSNLLESLALLEDEVSLFEKSARQFMRSHDSASPDDSTTSPPLMPPGMSDVAREHLLLAGRINDLRARVREINNYLDS
jgi:hypothetical protein